MEEVPSGLEGEDLELQMALLASTTFVPETEDRGTGSRGSEERPHPEAVAEARDSMEFLSAMYKEMMDSGMEADLAEVLQASLMESAAAMMQEAEEKSGGGIPALIEETEVVAISRSAHELSPTESQSSDPGMDERLMAMELDSDDEVDMDRILEIQRKNMMADTRRRLTALAKQTTIAKNKDCPICFDQTDLLVLDACKHEVCAVCMKGYVNSVFKDLSKYPLTCFQTDCDALLKISEMSYVLTDSPESLHLFDRFSALCAVPEYERSECPNCETMFALKDTYDAIRAPLYTRVETSTRTHCKECRMVFKTLRFKSIDHKHHCRLCGEVFCSDCTRFTMPLHCAHIVYQKRRIDEVKRNADQSMSTWASIASWFGGSADTGKTTGTGRLSATSSLSKSKKKTKKTKKKMKGISSISASTGGLSATSVPISTRPTARSVPKRSAPKAPILAATTEPTRKRGATTTDTRTTAKMKNKVPPPMSSVSMKPIAEGEFQRLEDLDSDDEICIAVIESAVAEVCESEEESKEESKEESETVQSPVAEMSRQTSETRFEEDWRIYNEVLTKEKVRSCEKCFVRFHRTVCPECSHIWCGHCREPFHDTDTGGICEEFGESVTGAAKRRKARDDEQLALSRDFIAKQSWSRCPGCKAIIAKTEGCNHMTHKKCPNPNEGKDCHFCYCCGEMLSGSGHKFESDGTTCHFPGGVFEDCRKYSTLDKIRRKAMLSSSLDATAESGHTKKSRECAIM